MLKTFLSFALCLSIAAPVFAQDSVRALAQDAVAAERMLWDSSLEMQTFRAGSSTIQMQAGKDVDVQALLIAAKIKPNDAPDVILNKVDAVRQQLYPNKEITLSATVPKTPEIDLMQVRLWRYYVSWNRSSGLYAYGDPLGAAVTVLGRVYGTWWYYDCSPCSSWKYRSTVTTGGSLTRSFSGGWSRLGFGYSPRTSGARADVIMYFFY